MKPRTISSAVIAMKVRHIYIYIYISLTMKRHLFTIETIYIDTHTRILTSLTLNHVKQQTDNRRYITPIVKNTIQ